ncbi:hypothetical protein [Arthrobacter sp. TWP1-1]|uniref:hypothetical protein n=1 Tax=Arthrobacter sp. TWP1-1 TaxID=2804568 RepID=UPI003CF6891E
MSLSTQTRSVAALVTAGLIFLTGCSSSEPSPAKPQPSVEESLVSLQDVIDSHSYLSDDDCNEPTTKRVSEILTVQVLECDVKPILKLVAVVGDTTEGFSSNVDRFKGSAQAMGKNWMVSVFPSELAKSDYAISGNDKTELEAEGIAEKLGGWVEVSPNLSDFYSSANN